MAAYGLHPAWLRANCQCDLCRDPVSGQRVAAITDQAADVTVTRAVESGAGLHVTFGPDGHEAVFTRTWLSGQTLAEPDARSEDAKRLWSARDFPAGPAQTPWQSYITSDAVRLRGLRGLLSSGFMLLTGVPQQPGAVLDVAASFGYVRETNYGRLFDVRVEATPANLANTGLPIGPHTANPYRDPVPTIQLLHCLTNAAAGGETGLLDGFRAAAQLRAEDPVAFECLTRTIVTFAYADETAGLRATKPMISVNPAGLIRGVRYNSRSMQPMRPRPGSTPAQAAEEMREFYNAYRAFAAIMLRPYLTLKFDFAPGDCVVFDNTRVLHSRSGFAATGERHLQGCYADLDGAESTVAVLTRSCNRHAAREADADDAPVERPLSAAG
ncbi:MAG TPA: TauD/TfdA family dioxygenase [Streptosporangiaceae bacterium]|nr:TauD/TfdA family dioxygenase [Streptosporangiaceae bacterium]